MALSQGESRGRSRRQGIRTWTTRLPDVQSYLLLLEIVFSTLFFRISQDVIKRFVLYVHHLSYYHIPESEYM